jgi:hypothetical protein
MDGSYLSPEIIGNVLYGLSALSSTPSPCGARGRRLTRACLLFRDRTLVPVGEQINCETTDE